MYSNVPKSEKKEKKCFKTHLFQIIMTGIQAKTSQTTTTKSRKRKPTQFLTYNHLMAADKIKRSKKKKERKKQKKESDKKLWTRKKPKN